MYGIHRTHWNSGIEHDSNNLSTTSQWLENSRGEFYCWDLFPPLKEQPWTISFLAEENILQQSEGAKKYFMWEIAIINIWRGTYHSPLDFLVRRWCLYTLSSFVWGMGAMLYSTKKQRELSIIQWLWSCDQLSCCSRVKRINFGMH